MLFQLCLLLLGSERLQLALSPGERGERGERGKRERKERGGERRGDTVRAGSVSSEVSVVVSVVVSVLL